MSTEKKLTAAERIELAQERRSKLREETDAAKLEQLATDLEAIADLEEELGESMVVAMDAKVWSPGCPVKIAVRAPNAAQYKRHLDTVMRGTRDKDVNATTSSVTLIGESCLVYPPKGELRDALIRTVPGAYLSAGQLAVQLGESEKANEKKG